MEAIRLQVTTESIQIDLICMQGEMLKMKFPFAREKLQHLFHDDKRGDVTIICGEVKLCLQKVFLRLESGYFKRFCLTTANELIINEPFKALYFTNIMSCFYGHNFECSRTQAIEYFDIIKFLEVETLLKQLRDDMITNISNYDIFVLMQMAHKHNEEDIFTASLRHIQDSNFEPLRYGKLGLFKCSEQLFKLIIQTHNRSKATKSKGLQFKQIDNLIYDFCAEKKYSLERHSELKFELIDKTCLTSQEYKELFIDAARSAQSIELRSSKQTQLSQSAEIQGKKELDLQIGYTFQKKRNEQLQRENLMLQNSINELAASSEENKRKHTELLEIIERMKESLHEKEQQDRKQKEIITRLDKNIIEVQGDLKKKAEVIAKLEQKVALLQKKKNFIDVDDESSSGANRTFSSNIYPASEIHLLVKSPRSSAIQKSSARIKQSQTKQKVEEQPQDDEEIQAKYLNRITFDQEPVCTPKNFLPILANFWDKNGFQTKQLKLVFRATPKQSFGKPDCLFNRNGLLFLLKTKKGEIIGGYTEAYLQKNTMVYVEDQNAFIFSLTQKQKFSIKKSAVTQAVYMSEKYLICFAKDLMISRDVLKEPSACSWPASYEGSIEDKRSSDWLTGQEKGIFSITEIEIYEVKSGAMDMVMI